MDNKDKLLKLVWLAAMTTTGDEQDAHAIRDLVNSRLDIDVKIFTKEDIRSAFFGGMNEGELYDIEQISQKNKDLLFEEFYDKLCKGKTHGPTEII